MVAVTKALPASPIADDVMVPIIYRSLVIVVTLIDYLHWLGSMVDSARLSCRSLNCFDPVA